MTAHLIVPLDGSPAAEAALPVAAALASRLRASVTLLHVLEQDAPQTIHGEPHLHTEQAAARYLADIAGSRFPSGVPVKVHVHAAKQVNVARGLAEHGAELQADMIVMCVHGPRGVSEALLGSLAQRSLALGHVPVLMVRSSYEGPFAPRSILAPLDGKQSHLPALEAAYEIAAAFAARLELLFVVHTFGSLSGGSWAASRMLPGTASRVLEMSEREARVYLGEWVAQAVSRGLAAGGRVLRGDPAKGILKSAHAMRSDLIVLATHGRAGAGAFWAGSVGSRVCASTASPVLLVPAGAEA
jgi:nucleotide-binding universal stress UspA family protein